MKKIDPTAIYESEELKEILRGVVKVETLREFGLVGLPGKGYWGQNVVDALTNYCNHLIRQRGTGKVIEKEDHLDAKKSRKNEVQNREIHPPPGTAKPMEGERERFRRRVSENSV
jgi:hypothetical protein